MTGHAGSVNGVRNRSRGFLLHVGARLCIMDMSVMPDFVGITRRANDEREAPDTETWARFFQLAPD